MVLLNPKPKPGAFASVCSLYNVVPFSTTAIYRYTTAAVEMYRKIPHVFAFPGGSLVLVLAFSYVALLLSLAGRFLAAGHNIVLGGSHSPLPQLLVSNSSSPTNSSQSDTATTAEPVLSMGSAGNAAAGPAHGAAADAAVSRQNVSTAAGQRGPAGKCQHMHGQHMHSSSAMGGYDIKREWLYRLVTFPHYFTPCTSCCGGSHTPKREQLMTLFDTRAPHRVFCCHCPSPKGSTGHFSASHGRDGALLQVWRLDCETLGCWWARQNTQWL